MSVAEEKAGAILPRAVAPGMVLAPGKKGFYASLRIDEISVASNVRKTFDEEKLQELAESVKEYGVLQPLVVRMIEDPSGRDRGTVYVLVAGERRLRAARMAGLREVPCRIVELTAKQAAEVQLLENLQREDLNPMEEAEGYVALVNEFQYTQQDIAEKIGKKQPYVAGRIGLLRLPPKVQESITRGIVNVSAAEVMAKYATAAPDVVVKVAEKMKDRPIPVAKIREEIDNEVARKCKNLDNKYSWSSPKFDPTSCLQSCPKVLHLKTYGDTEERPYCSDIQCWLEKDRVARDALREAALETAGEGAVDLETVPNWVTLSPDDLARCDAGCSCRVRGVKKDYDGTPKEVDACLKPDCRNERIDRMRREQERARVRKQDDEVARLVHKCDSLGYAAALGSLPHPLLVSLAAPLLEEHVEWYQPDMVKQFAEDIRWEGQLDNWTPRQEPIKFRQALERLPGPVLARLVLDIMVSHDVRIRGSRQPVSALYMLGEPIPQPEPQNDTEEDDESGCPDDCDGDCDNCDLAREDNLETEPDELEEEAGADPVSPPAVESPAEYPAEPAPPEDPNWTAVVRAAFATVGAPIEACTRETKLEDLSEYWDDFMSSSFGIALENRFDIQVPDNVSKAWVTLGDAADFVMEQLAQEQE